MRLGFHYHIPAMEKDGQIFLPGYLGRFIDSLANQFEQVVCFLHSPLVHEEPSLDYMLRSSKVKLVNIGSHASVPKRMLGANKVRRLIKGNLNEIDVMLIRAPTPLLPHIADACGKLPIALLIVGDYLAGVDDLPQPLWRKELIRLWSRWNVNGQLRIAQRSLTFVNSRLLFNQLQGRVPNLVETRTTTLTEDDFYHREDTCTSRPIKLLYTGRITRSKGILDILEAVKILVKQGEDIVFDLVGMIDKSEPLLDELTHKAAQYGISDRIKFHGYFPVGPELFRFYKNADIYVIASQSSEGFPRTIWEAMANSLPVIATNVGAIPDFVGDSAFLVDPNNSSELAGMICQVIANPKIRSKKMREGYLLARENTLEFRSQQMFAEIESWLEIKKHE